ncbi:MAG TPA: LapA family protein [Myxococcota bacterium]|nr:LapA family protein [Myxococcota bacterium]
MRSWLSVTFGVLLAALLVYVVISNNDIVIVTLPLVKWPTKLWSAMVASAVVGAGATLLLTSWPLLRLKLQSRKHTRRIAQLEQEVHGLRTLPIASETAAAPSSVQKV